MFTKPIERTLAQGAILPLLVTGLLYSRGRTVHPTSTVGPERVTLRGRVFDGRFPEADERARGAAATVQAYEYRIRSDGCAAGRTEPTRLLGQTRTDGRGDFALPITPSSATMTRVWVQASEAGFLTTGRVTRLAAGDSDIKLYLAPTAISGVVLGPDGGPAATDLWVLRQSMSGYYLPEEIAGGRTLRLPMGVHHIGFGLDSDAAGNFIIPISRPGVRYELLVAVDTGAHRFASYVTAPFLVSANELTTLCSIHLSAPGGALGGKVAQQSRQESGPHMP